jgi:hypothetical protein
MLAAGGERLKKARPSFLKKRSKKLLRTVPCVFAEKCALRPGRWAKFIASFFQKERFLEGLAALQEEPRQ